MKDERGVPIAFHLDGGELDAKIVRAGEVLKEAAAVEELAEALVAFVIVRDGGAAVGEEFFFFICVVDVDEADRARSFF